MFNRHATKFSNTYPKLSTKQKEFYEGEIDEANRKYFLADKTQPDNLPHNLGLSFLAFGIPYVEFVSYIGILLVKVPNMYMIPDELLIRLRDHKAAGTNVIFRNLSKRKRCKKGFKYRSEYNVFNSSKFDHRYRTIQTILDTPKSVHYILGD